ncbi:MAG: SGNH/GDSL hydrolase family protein [Clostridiales bacterium]|nr:SGNH/GDSL hydrolase family protein [Clostridiales bacterium]
MIKKIASEILKIISFMLIFMILLSGVSFLCFSEKAVSQLKSGWQDSYNFLSDEPNTLQIVGVGNSDLYSGFSPLDLWKQYGLTSTVCAEPRQKIRDSLELLKLVFETQSPRVVLIETDMLYDRNLKNGNVRNQDDSLEYFMENADPKYFDSFIENLFTVFKFHNIWKSEDHDLKSKLYNTHGYKYNSHTYKLGNTDYMKETDQEEPLNKRNTAQMDDLLDFCKSKNAAAILLAIPSPASWNYARHLAVERYAEERGVPFLDLNLCYREMGLDMQTCFRDKGNHLNYSGTVAATAFLGKYIQENYSLPVHSGDNAYQHWDEDLGKFEALRENEDLD